MHACHNCGHQFGPHDEIYRSTVCPECGRDVKVCLNCRFYAPGQHWDCHETIDEQVKDKDRANFCSWFKMSDADETANADNHPGARDAFNNLFGNDK